MRKKPKDEWLAPLVNAEAALAREFRRRKSEYVKKSILPASVSTMIEEGWEIDKKLKNRVRVKKKRGLDERLENRLFILDIFIYQTNTKLPGL